MYVPILCSIIIWPTGWCTLYTIHLHYRTLVNISSAMEIELCACVCSELSLIEHFDIPYEIDMRTAIRYANEFNGIPIEWCVSVLVENTIRGCITIADYWLFWTEFEFNLPKVGAVLTIHTRTRTCEADTRTHVSIQIAIILSSDTLGQVCKMQSESDMRMYLLYVCMSLALSMFLSVSFSTITRSHSRSVQWMVHANVRIVRCMPICENVCKVYTFS